MTLENPKGQNPRRPGRQRVRFYTLTVRRQERRTKTSPQLQQSSLVTGLRMHCLDLILVQKQLSSLLGMFCLISLLPIANFVGCWMLNVGLIRRSILLHD